MFTLLIFCNILITSVSYAVSFHLLDICGFEHGLDCALLVFLMIQFTSVLNDLLCLDLSLATSCINFTC